VESLSLFAHCQKCASNCCKASSTIGAPILSKNEADIISAFWGKGVLNSILSPENEMYWLPKDQPQTNVCIFLKDNKCQIQTYKPMDCLCYPIKAIYQGSKIIFVADRDCAALPGLTDDFIIKAKKIALISIQRFHRETYQHWLDHFIGWVRNSAKILK
jgi:Fe-S-cluster containining protein